MPYKTGAWGKQAKERSKRRTKWFVTYRKKERPKRNARALVYIAIKRGGLIKKPCEVCGTIKKIHAHHDDYAKPLDVRWFCFYHHRLYHKKTAN